VADVKCQVTELEALGAVYASLAFDRIADKAFKAGQQGRLSIPSETD
jgi:hypothetical protein